MTLVDQCAKRACFFEHRKSDHASVLARTLVLAGEYQEIPFNWPNPIMLGFGHCRFSGWSAWYVWCRGKRRTV